MTEGLHKLLDEVKEKIHLVQSEEQLKSLQANYVGKKGAITAIFKTFGKLDPEARKKAGQEANKVKTEIQEIFTEKADSLQEAAVKIDFDITLPWNPVNSTKKPDIRNKAKRHPILAMIDKLNDAFATLGFEIYEGPEITSEFYSFDNMNFPDNHPARESMDTYWLAGTENKAGTERLCMRPHLTGGSVRYMQEHQPPFRFVYPGKVFRNESTDASHERAFFQYEALIVDKEVPFSSVRIMVHTILETVFNRRVTTRMRSGFFPFVEPGFEIDMQCLVCEGAGCSVCGRTGWIEVMPGGPPHPNVLKAGGIDPEKWQGAYINVGLDRMVMMKYAIDDVRLFHSGDLRFLTQFN